MMTWEEAVQWLREQPEQEALVRACYFDDPLIEAAQRYCLEPEWLALKELIAMQSGDVLDVGAGRGIASYGFAREGWNVTALEPNPSSLVGAEAIRQLACEAGLSIRVVEEWGERLPFSDNSFDIVHARQVLHHARDLQKFCAELFRVLKPGGTMISTREHVVDRPEQMHLFLDSHPLHHLYGGENAFSLHEYVQALIGAGFEIKKVLSPFETPINYFPATYEEVKKIIADRIHWPFPKMMPDILIRLLSKRLTTPGRLYSFICLKSNHAQ